MLGQALFFQSLTLSTAQIELGQADPAQEHL